MSNYGWEKGSLIVPAAEWAGFKKAIREDVGRFNEKVLAFATKLHAHLMTLPASSRRDDPRVPAYEFALAEIRVSSHDDAGQHAREDIVERAISSVSKCDYDAAKRQMRYSIVKPRKGDFGLPGNNVLSFRGNSCSLSFDNETRTVTWATDDGNRSVERARDSHLGRSFFRHLRTVAWTRGTGGTFEGNDEYNEDAGRENGHGGGSYVTERFGPVGKDRFESEMKVPGSLARTPVRARR